MLRKILLLLGETPSSISARRYALRLARGTKAGVTGFSGIDLPYIESAMPGRVGASTHAVRLQESLKKQADQIARHLRELFDEECRADEVRSNRCHLKAIRLRRLPPPPKATICL